MADYRGSVVWLLKSLGLKAHVGSIPTPSIDTTLAQLASGVPVRMAKGPAEQLIELIAAEAKAGPLVGRYTEVASLTPPNPGAFSIMLTALDARTGRRVALKVLHPGADPYRAACFEREVKVAERLVGRDNIVQLVGGLEQVTVLLTHPATGMLLPFTCRLFAMELARETFATYLLRHRRPRPVYRRLEIMREIVKGVGRLHRAGYCHRDLKPDNILRGRRGTIAIGDLGTSRLHSGLDPIALDYSLPRGDLRYSAPEMFSAGATVPSLYVGADWFSVGSIMFEALTGQNLYVAIGLRDWMEIKNTLAAAADISSYMKQVGAAVGLYPIPAIGDYSEPWLQSLGPMTHNYLTALVRELCHFDPSRRLVDFSHILRRLDIAIIRSRRDHLAYFNK